MRSLLCYTQGTRICGCVVVLLLRAVRSGVEWSGAEQVVSLLRKVDGSKRWCAAVVFSRGRDKVSRAEPGGGTLLVFFVGRKIDAETRHSQGLSNVRVGLDFCLMLLDQTGGMQRRRQS